jgi:putative thioredoxin
MRTEHLDGQKIISEATSAPENIELQMQCADLEIMAGHLEPGFKRLLALITLTSGQEQKQVKERLIELFALVDPADPRVIKARAALASALF